MLSCSCRISLSTSRSGFTRCLYKAFHLGSPSPSSAWRVAAMSSYEEVRKAAEAAGQGHVFEHWDTLDADQQERLLGEIKVRLVVQCSAGVHGRSTRTYRLLTPDMSGSHKLLVLTHAGKRCRRHLGATFMPGVPAGHRLCIRTARLRR